MFTDLSPQLYSGIVTEMDIEQVAGMVMIPTNSIMNSIARCAPKIFISSEMTQ